MQQLSFGARIGLALTLPFRVLANGRLAARILELNDAPALSGEVASTPEPLAAPEPVAAAEPGVAAPLAEVKEERDLSPALQLLGILQREGRFVDFLQEEMGSFEDAEIGAAARVVQEGCKRALADYVKIVSIRSEEEGAQISLEPGFDAARIRLTGNVVGEAPYRGTLAHHGWLAESVELPESSAEHDARVLAPAEVEL